MFSQCRRVEHLPSKHQIEACGAVLTDTTCFKATVTVAGRQRVTYEH